MFRKAYKCSVASTIRFTVRYTIVNTRNSPGAPLMKIHKLTLLLLVLVLGTLALTFARRNQTPGSRPKETAVLNKQEKKGDFPVANYDEPELTDPKKNQARKEKKLRHNNFSIVAKNP